MSGYQHLVGAVITSVREDDIFGVRAVTVRDRFGEELVLEPSLDDLDGWINVIDSEGRRR